MIFHIIVGSTVMGQGTFVIRVKRFISIGFHIYDVGFQSPNVEAARPLVYATSLLLVMVIIGLNIGMGACEMA